MEQLLHDIADAYDKTIVDTGRQPELFLLLAFFISFGFIRTSAHMIRSPRFKWWPGNVDMGGTHIHHLVWGILLLLIIGYVAIAFEPESPMREILAILFGVGMGLTLDEFALWLNLKDVYWSEKGRESIDAVIITGICALLIFLGVRIWIDAAHEVEALLRLWLAADVLFAIAVAVANAFKSKYGMVLLSFFASPIGLVSAVRLARPTSLWARMYGKEKMSRSRARFAHEDTQAQTQSNNTEE